MEQGKRLYWQPEQNQGDFIGHGGTIEVHPAGLLTAGWAMSAKRIMKPGAPGAVQPDNGGRNSEAQRDSSNRDLAFFQAVCYNNDTFVNHKCCLR